MNEINGIMEEADMKPDDSDKEVINNLLDYD